jgi:hypothetical protein
MAGSYHHIVDEKNEFQGVDLLDNLGDAHEALEECHFMIKHFSGGDLNKIFEAHRAYVASPEGLNNPDYAAKMKAEDYWSAE